MSIMDPTLHMEQFDPREDPFVVMEAHLDEWAENEILAMFEALDAQEDGDALHEQDTPTLTDADLAFMGIEVAA